MQLVPYRCILIALLCNIDSYIFIQSSYFNSIGCICCMYLYTTQYNQRHEGTKSVPQEERRPKGDFFRLEGVSAVSCPQSFGIVDWTTQRAKHLLLLSTEHLVEREVTQEMKVS